MAERLDSERIAASMRKEPGRTYMASSVVGADFSDSRDITQCRSFPGCAGEEAVRLDWPGKSSHLTHCDANSRQLANAVVVDSALTFAPVDNTIIELATRRTEKES